MYNTNMIIVEGNLVRKPELKTLPSGLSVASMSIATNFKRKDKEDITEFHNIIVFGAQAESCAKYLDKGHSAQVIGRNQTRSWDKDGVKQYRTEIVANDITFGAKPQQTTVPNTDVPYPEEDINPDSVPF